MQRSNHAIDNNNEICVDLLTWKLNNEWKKAIVNKLVIKAMHLQLEKCKQLNMDVHQRIWKVLQFGPESKLSEDMQCMCDTLQCLQQRWRTCGPLKNFMRPAKHLGETRNRGIFDKKCFKHQCFLCENRKNPLAAGGSAPRPPWPPAAGGYQVPTSFPLKSADAHTSDWPKE